MDGRARWYRLRMCRPASYHQHSRSASFDTGGSGPSGDYQGAQDEPGDAEAAGTGTGRRRTTPGGHSTTQRAPSSTGRTAAASDVLHSPAADVRSYSSFCSTFYASANLVAGDICSRSVRACVRPSVQNKHC